MWWNVIHNASLVQRLELQLPILVLFVFVHSAQGSNPVTLDALNLAQPMTSQRSNFSRKANLANLSELM